MQEHPDRRAAEQDDEVLVGEVLQDDDVEGGGDDAQTRLDTMLSAVLARVRATVEADVRRARDAHPELPQDDLARLVVKRAARRVGWASFATGFGGIVSAAVNVPSVLALQAVLVLSVAEVYDQLDSPDLKQDVLLIVGGESVAGVLRTFGVAATNDFSKRWVDRSITRETMKKVNRVVSRKILTKAGERSLTSFTKLVPVAGAAVGYVFDRSYARALGERSVRYYSGT